MGSGVAINCGVGHRHGLDPAWLWLWCRPGATAPIRPLAWEPPYAEGAVLKTEEEIVVCIPFVLYVLFFCFLGPHLCHMEVPRLGAEPELQLLAYATATLDLSHICDPYHSHSNTGSLTH